MSTRYRCSLCPVLFAPAPGQSSSFCSSCLARMAEQSAAARERRARVAGGDLGLFNDGGAVSAEEHQTILDVRRRGNFGGIVV